jgi:hypothetical protein
MTIGKLIECLQKLDSPDTTAFLLDADEEKYEANHLTVEMEDGDICSVVIW